MTGRWKVLIVATMLPLISELTLCDLIFVNIITNLPVQTHNATADDYQATRETNETNGDDSSNCKQMLPVNTNLKQSQWNYWGIIEPKKMNRPT
jgi:hypothetical protein